MIYYRPTKVVLKSNDFNKIELAYTSYQYHAEK